MPPATLFLYIFIVSFYYGFVNKKLVNCEYFFNFFCFHQKHLPFFVSLSEQSKIHTPLLPLRAKAGYRFYRSPRKLLYINDYISVGFVKKHVAYLQMLAVAAYNAAVRLRIVIARVDIVIGI